MSDLISRQAVIEALGTPHGILYPIRTIEELPSAESIPVEWIAAYADRFGFSLAEDIIKGMLNNWEREQNDQRVGD